MKTFGLWSSMVSNHFQKSKSWALGPFKAADVSQFGDTVVGENQA
jgi:hypothetical protein